MAKGDKAPKSAAPKAAAKGEAKAAAKPAAAAKAAKVLLPSSCLAHFIFHFFVLAFQGFR